MNAAARSLLFVVLFSMVGLILSAESAIAQDDMLLYDGETAAIYSFGSANAANAFRGNYCFEGLPDPWHRPGITLAGLPSYRKDISGYDELWLFAKTDQPTLGVTIEIHFYTTSGDSNYVDASPYMTGGKLDDTYRLIRIPISAFKSATCPLTSIDGIYFGKARPTTGHKIYIDEIWAVKFGSVNPNQAPFIAGRESISFGDVGVRTSLTKSATLTNVGPGPLVVSGITITGAQSGDFSTPTAPFTLQAGQSQQVDAVYTPSVMGDASATLILTHTPTVLSDTTRIALSGRGLGPLLVLPASPVDLGPTSQGCTVTWLLPINNIGNQDLVISNPTVPSPFSARPAALTVPPNGAAGLLVSFTPASTGKVTGQLGFTSNDPNNAQPSILLNAEGVERTAGAALLTVRASQVTSSTVTLAWPQFTGADTFKVYLAAEPEGTRGQPPLKMPLSQFPGTATGCVVDKLAAAVDAFFHVDALAGTEVVASGNVHARTLGGPRATLDSPVREVHLYAPDIIQVVLADFRVHSFSAGNNWYDSGIDELVGDRGASWQAGPWTVQRSDGRGIPVLSIYRQSQPMGMNYYELCGGSPHVELLDVDHNIYLVLGEPVGTSEILHITGPSFQYEILTESSARVTQSTSAEFTLPFSDRYLETPVIQVNQVGYSPQASRRYAYVSGWMGDGGPLSLSSFPTQASVIEDMSDPLVVRRTVASGLSISQRSANDEDAGTAVNQIDLAAAPPAEGTVYRVQVPGVGVSWPTQVSETAAFKTFYTVARGLFHNRWYGDLRSDLTEWSRPADHGTVYQAEESDPLAKFAETTPHTPDLARELHGGHHDAGDYDLRVFHTWVGILLLRAFEMNQTAFTDGQLNIPESGNGIPDLLDEALWSLEGWVALQEDDGGVRMGAESYAHPCIRPANEDDIPYWTYSRGLDHTGKVAGMFAQAARLLQPYDSARAALFLNRAKKAYGYVVANGMGPASAGPMMYAAAELAAVTGESAYLTMVRDTWEANRPSYSPLTSVFDRDMIWMTNDACPIVWDHLLGYLSRPSAAQAHVTAAADRLRGASEAVTTALESLHAHRNGRPFASTDWGHGTAVGQYLFRTYAALQMGGFGEAARQDLVNAVSLSSDYVLGCNPAGMSWITGLGSRRPLDPLHNDSLAFMKLGHQEPVPGIPVYGPTGGISSQGGSEYGYRLAYPAYEQHPHLRRYGDVHFFVNQNEFTVWECQAPAAELFAALVGPGMMPPPSWRPGGPEHTNALAPREKIVPTDAPQYTQDTTPPNPGQLTAPAYSKTAPLTVSYSGAYDAQSGLKNVKLWVKIGTTGAWRNTGQTSTAASGAFQFQPTGDNRYYFFLQAEDNAGNVSSEPTDESVLGNPAP
jgi:endoglucanase